MHMCECMLVCVWCVYIVKEVVGIDWFAYGSQRSQQGPYPSAVIQATNARISRIQKKNILYN